MVLDAQTRLDLDRSGTLAAWLDLTSCDVPRRGSDLVESGYGRGPADTDAFLVAAEREEWLTRAALEPSISQRALGIGGQEWRHVKPTDYPSLWSWVRGPRYPRPETPMLDKLTDALDAPIHVHATPNYYSASQLKTFRGCKRAWYYDKIVGLPRAESPALSLGKAVHAELEGYLRGRTPIEDLGPLARVAAEKLPVPSSGLDVEFEFTLRIDDGITPRDFVGFVDLLVPPDVRPSGVPLISDHKTLSNMQYALTEYEIAEDVQMLAYGQLALLRYPDAKAVELQHTAILTRGKPAARNTSVVVDRPTIEKRWLKHLQILPAIDATRACTSASDVEPNGRENDTCHKYGGCPYMLTCNLDSLRRAKETTMVRPPDAPKSSYLNPTTPVAYVESPKKKKKKVALEVTEVAPSSVDATEATPTVVYIDCLPVGGSPVTLEAWAAPLCTRIEAETGRGWQLHSYREGTGLLVAYAGEATLPSEVACSSGAPLTAVLLESILPRAARVIRGVR